MPLQDDPAGAPRRLPWDEAIDAVARACQDAGASRQRPVLVGVTGPVGSGKSTLARRISDCVLTTDDYLPDYDKVGVHERDLPESADLPRLARDLGELKQGRAARVPVWSFHSHAREGERTVEPAPVVVCEGIHALHETIAALLDIRVFVDAPREVRRDRWAKAARQGERGWGEAETLEFFDAVAEPTFARRAAQYLSRAHFVVSPTEPRAQARDHT